MYNLGKKAVDKFTKLSKIDFYMEFATADFLRLFTGKRQNLAFGLPVGSLFWLLGGHQMQVFQGFY